MSRGPLVLMYHAVDTRPAGYDPDNLFVPPQSFARQLDTLERRGLRPIDLDTYLAGRGGPGDVLLTFDDAYESTLTHAAPALAARGWPAVVYVASRMLGGRSSWNHCSEERLLDADELRELQGLGFALGAHTRTHADLRTLPPGELEREVRGCREDLAEVFGEAPTSFAYPYGAHDPAARAAVAAAGFGQAFSVHDGAGPLATARVDVNAADTDHTFRLKTCGIYPHLRRALGVAPPLRRAVHRLVGHATR